MQQHPLSPDEHAAMVRYVSDIRRQLQEASDLFTNRYGKNSSIAEIALKALVSTTLLEHELTLIDIGSELDTRLDTRPFGKVAGASR